MTIDYAGASPRRPQPGTILQANPRTSYSSRTRSRASRTGIRFTSSAHGRFARALSQNGIAWLYKPRTFSIDWDAEGNLRDSITPDFYLPDYQQYLELTTPGEHCIAVTAKRLRMLRRLHHELDLRLIVGENYPAIIRRFLTAGVWIP